MNPPKASTVRRESEILCLLRVLKMRHQDLLLFQIDAFARCFDGFSIGSNDLTQLTLGVDRDSEIVAFDFDERDEGVKTAVRLAVEGCKRNGKHSGICGQAPSDYPEITQFLVELGIDSISLNADSIIGTTRLVLGLEAKAGTASRNVA